MSRQHSKSGEELRMLGDREGVIIGRKKSVYEKEGLRKALHIGRVVEEPYRRTPLYMDSLYPHVVFIAGARGSGKSYTMGVIAEELADNNPHVAVVIVDPIGVFWSMKVPNRMKEELELLVKWGLEPKGYENVRVYIPYGFRDKVPEGTYDSTFSIPADALTVDDWSLTFGIDRFSPMALLLEKAISHLGKGYTVDDIITLLESDFPKEHNFRKESARALVSRLSASRHWGIFGKGTSLFSVIRKGEIAVVDVSFLEENVAALVVGLLARYILAERKKAVRSATSSLLGSNPGEPTIPPVWLFVDEAHTLAPSGSRKTAATEPLVEYVKQGRRPGCSIVMATQQPSAIDTRILSQVDIMIVHKLIFSDDVRAVVKRMPAILPREYGEEMMRLLPTGRAVIGDREGGANRAFLADIRPRKSQHEGREVKVDEEVVVKREEPKRQRAFVLRVTEERARRILEELGRGILDRLLRRRNKVKKLELMYTPVWEARLVFYRNKETKNAVVYVDGYHGELLYYDGQKLGLTNGLKYIYKLSRAQRRIVMFLKRKGEASLQDISVGSRTPYDVAEKEVETLVKAGIVRKNGVYRLAVEIDIPLEPDHPFIRRVGELDIRRMRIDEKMVLKPVFDRERVKDVVSSIWPAVVVKGTDVVYRPVWVGEIEGKKVMVDAVTGRVEREVVKR